MEKYLFLDPAEVISACMYPGGDIFLEAHKLNLEDVERWKSYTPSLQGIVSKISDVFGLKSEILFINEDINSHLCIRFYKEGWDLSIGWEWVDKYNGNPVVLQKDIENGYFQSFLEKEVGYILFKIEENRLPMK